MPENYNSTLRRIERTVERITKLPIAQIRETPVDEMKRKVEAQYDEQHQITGAQTRVIDTGYGEVKVLT